ncbi:MAG TPA: hypothetical protein P5291_11405, partial [Flavobacteriales bacterium]|nr:hypothetical protein [Flavobacteriales bacterium]
AFVSGDPERLHQIVANLAAFAIAAVIMFAAAWLIERLVLRYLVNQEGTTLLMATLGIGESAVKMRLMRARERAIAKYHELYPDEP